MVICTSFQDADALYAFKSRGFGGEIGLEAKDQFPMTQIFHQITNNRNNRMTNQISKISILTSLFDGHLNSA